MAGLLLAPVRRAPESLQIHNIRQPVAYLGRPVAVAGPATPITTRWDTLAVLVHHTSAARGPTALDVAFLVPREVVPRVVSNLYTHHGLPLCSPTTHPVRGNVKALRFK